MTSPHTSIRVLYIYYRTPDTPEILRPSLHAFLRQVRQATGVQGRLLCRGSSDGSTLTWLEAYEAVPDGFSAELRKLWARFEMDKSPFGDRREEQFELLPDDPK